ncbi:MAG TPA: PLP-dependent aminotransferase family protein [Streptosporangiaceae bacterium]
MSKVNVELPLALDRSGRVPLAVQITGQLRAAVSGNRLRAGERLPSSRALAASLGVSRTVVTNAYLQLFAEGWLEGRHGSGTYVAQGAASEQAVPHPCPQTRAAPAQLQSAEPLPGYATARPAPASIVSGRAAAPVRPSAPDRPAMGSVAPARTIPGPSTLGLPVPGLPVPGHPVPTPALIPMLPGIPWAAGIDQAAWRRAWRRAGTAFVSRWPDPRGLPALRAALCGYLRRSRGLSCGPDHVLITRGVANGLSLLAAAVLQPGGRAGIEDPGYPVGRSILTARGATLLPCRVDSHGLVTGNLPGDLRLIYTTPAHQYPLGGRLPVPRRQALAAWARATGALIVEDDYDSEFRYDVAPLPALYGLDPDVVTYLGTTAKTLTPTFGVGWLVARPDLVTTLAGLRENLGDRTDEAAQHAMTELIESGDLDRHVRRMRREYARRRDAIVSILGDPAVPGRLLGDTAGLHVVLELHRGRPGEEGGTAREDEVAAAARDSGVAVHTLRRYFAGPQDVQGLALGYGGLPVGQVTAVATVLRDILLARPASR